jgi:hypothetical protein
MRVMHPTHYCTLQSAYITFFPIFDKNIKLQSSEIVMKLIPRLFFTV